MTPLLASLGSLSLGAIRRSLIVFVPLKCTWKPCLLHVLLNFSPKPGMYGMTLEMFLLCLLLLFSLMLLLGCPSVWLLSLLFLCLSSNCCCSLFRAQLGNWQATRAFLKCSSSLTKSSGVLEITLALWASVLYTLVWQWWSGCCPNVNTGQYVLVSCKPLWVGCCRVLV